MASVLVNISKKEHGRKLLLDQKRCLLKQIVRNDSKSLLRKRGVCGRIFSVQDGYFHEYMDFCFKVNYLNSK